MKNICHEPPHTVKPSNTTGCNDDVHAMISKANRGIGARQAPRERVGTAAQTKTTVK